MNENEKPALGSTEAAVLTVVELIARAAQMSEQHMSYWLDLYYQVRSRYEVEHALTLDDMVVKTEGPDPVMARLDELEKKIDELKNGVTLKMDLRPVSPEPYRTAEGLRPWHSIVPPTPPDHYPPAPPRPGNKAKEATDDATSSVAACHLPLEGKAEEANDVPELAPMKSSKVLPAEDRKAVAKAKRGAAAAEKQQKDQRAYKMRIADRLREARAAGVKIADIVEASCGKVPDGAVMTILEGGFRPIDEYRALEAALDKCAE